MESAYKQGEYLKDGNFYREILAVDTLNKVVMVDTYAPEYDHSYKPAPVIGWFKLNRQWFTFNELNAYEKCSKPIPETPNENHKINRYTRIFGSIYLKKI